MKIEIDHEELRALIEEKILAGLELDGWVRPGSKTAPELERQRLARERAGNIVQVLRFEAELAAEG